MPGMNDFREKARGLWMKSMNAIGNTAAGIANNTRNKVDEMNLQNRRREVCQDIAARVYALWQKGEELPEELSGMLGELQELDEKLNDLQAARYSRDEIVIESTEEEDYDEATEPDEADEPRGTEFMTDMEAHLQSIEEPFVSDAPEIVKDEINARFDTPEVTKKAEAVNSTLEGLSDRMRRFDESAEEEESRE